MPEQFDAAALVQTLTEFGAGFAGDAGDTSASEFVDRDSTFISSVARVLAGLLPEHQGASNRAGVILLLPTVQSKTKQLDYRLSFLDSGKHDLAGRIVLTNEVASFGWAEDHDFDDDALVARVLDDDDLNSLPSVVYDPVGRNIRFYPKGFEDLGHVLRWDLDDSTPLSWTAVESAVESVVRRVLATPSQQIPRSVLWKNASSYYTSENVEAHIQGAIKSHLIGAFPLHLIEHEIPVDSGRFDLAITRYLSGVGAWRYEGVLELKVLRSFGSGGRTYSATENVQAARSSVVQAWCYGVDKQAVWSAACCFDMRQGEDVAESCFEVARPMSLTLGVFLRRWRLFNSATAVREGRLTSTGAED